VAALKWALVLFLLAALALVVLSKLIAFLNPPQPGRPRPAALRSVERALRWTLVVPVALGLALLAATLARG
jgi:Na+-driven multidrug efflux pump